jgi:hypothetical protein
MSQISIVVLNPGSFGSEINLKCNILFGSEVPANCKPWHVKKKK